MGLPARRCSFHITLGDTCTKHGSESLLERNGGPQELRLASWHARTSSALDVQVLLSGLGDPSAAVVVLRSLNCIPLPSYPVCPSTHPATQCARANGTMCNNTGCISQPYIAKHTCGTRTGMDQIEFALVCKLCDGERNVREVASRPVLKAPCLLNLFVRHQLFKNTRDLQTKGNQTGLARQNGTHRRPSQHKRH